MNELLKALGATDETNAVAIATKINGFLASMCALMGVGGMDEAMKAIQSQMALVQAVEKATGKKGEEAIGLVHAWKTSEERAVAAETKLKAQEKAQADTEAKTFIDGLIAKRRLVPAGRESAEIMYSDFGMKGLQSFANVLPAEGTIVATDEPEPTEGKPTAPKAGELTAHEREVMRATGKSKTDMLALRDEQDDDFSNGARIAIA